MSQLQRPAAIVLPILRDADLVGVYGAVGNRVYTWTPDVDHRDYPFIEIYRTGGNRNVWFPKLMGFPVIELSVTTNVGLPETEQLYEDALEALYDARDNQTTTAGGSIHSLTERTGATNIASPYQDSWRVQGLIRLGIRPPTN